VSAACKWLHEQLEILSLISYPFRIDRLPEDGVYCFYERGEVWGHSGEKPRIVRVGTHRQGNFRSRMAEHYLLDESKMNFNEMRPAPKDRSIFRKNIGRALLNRESHSYLKVWDLDFMTSLSRERFGHLRNIPLEKKIEEEITRIIREDFSFRFVLLADQKLRMGSSGLESRLIGTLARCGECRPSRNWLGRRSPKPPIRQSGLWLVQHLQAHELSEDERGSFLNAVKETEGWLGRH
jgi:hypothetical protein